MPTGGTIKSIKINVLRMIWWTHGGQSLLNWSSELAINNDASGLWFMVRFIFAVQQFIELLARSCGKIPTNCG